VTLERTAAAHFGADPALCRAVPGSEAALRLIAPELGLPGRHVPLTYRSHVEAFDEARVHQIGAMDPPTVLVIANPNNPDGMCHRPDQIAALLAAQEDKGGWLLVDEAFADCDPGVSVAAMVRPERRLIVLRSFGKFFGLAGLRLGFVVAPPDLLLALGRRMGAWPINSAALAIGQAAYADDEWIAQTIQTLRAKAATLDHVLHRHGLHAQGACPLFRLVKTPAATTLFEGLARRRILTRPFAQAGNLLRLGLPQDDAALARLYEALTGLVRHD
jgi:cobalamin biosynthetic protein CobC